MAYYSVHKGFQNGIYTSWDECKKQIHGYKGAIYKKFKHKSKAECFMKYGFYKNQNNINENEIYIYTDGSLIRRNNNIYCGYGVYIPKLNYSFNSKIIHNKTINRAELSAIIKGIEYIENQNINKKINIVTDSMYCIYILNGTGKRYKLNNYKDKNGKEVKNKDLIETLMKKIENIEFNTIKVNSHTNFKDEHSKCNKYVDELAKKAALL